LFRSAIAAGTIWKDIDADEFLNAASSLYMSVHDERASHAGRMVDLLVNRRRYPSELCRHRLTQALLSQGLQVGRSAKRCRSFCVARLAA
jgi:hypothetical protein